MQKVSQEWLPTPEKTFVAASRVKVGKGGIRSKSLKRGNCPVCGGEINPNSFRIDTESFLFLKKLEKEGTLQAFLRLAKVHIYDIMRLGAPTASGLTKAVSMLKEELHNITNRELETLKTDLAKKFQEVLAEMGFPEPAQMQILAQFTPKAVDLMHELIRLQKVPKEKGKEGEITLLKHLRSYFPEDEIIPLGKSGETDIVAKPYYESQRIGFEVLIELKKNNQTGWRRTYIDEVRRHMMNHDAKFAILAVDVMPKVANGYLTEFHSEGVIFVTSSINCHIAYGALRSTLITTFKLARRSIDVAKALSEKNVMEKIQSLYTLEEYHRKIRKNADFIRRKGMNILEETDSASEFLRDALKNLQKTIEEAVEKSEGEIPP